MQSMNYRGLFPRALIIFLENNDKTHIASQFKLVFAIITEFMLIIDIIFSTQFFNFTTKINY